MHAVMEETLCALTEQVEAFCQKVIAPRASDIDQSNAFPAISGPAWGAGSARHHGGGGV